MSFWDKMTEPKPINKKFIPDVAELEHENRELKMQISLLKEELSALRNIAAEKARPVTGLTMGEMLASVLRYTGITEHGVRHEGRLKKDEVRARTLFCLIAHYNGRSDNAIGGYLNRNRYVALDARRNHQKRLKKTDYEFLKLHSNGHL